MDNIDNNKDKGLKPSQYLKAMSEGIKGEVFLGMKEAPAADEPQPGGGTQAEDKPKPVVVKEKYDSRRGGHYLLTREDCSDGMSPHSIHFVDNEGSVADLIVEKVIGGGGACAYAYLVKWPGTGQYSVMKEFYPDCDRRGRWKVKKQVDGRWKSAKIIEKDKNNVDVCTWDYQLDYNRNNDDVEKVKEKFRKEPERILELMGLSWQDVKVKKKDLHLVVPHSQCFECHGNLYYLMEYLDGDTLDVFVNNHLDSLNITSIGQLMLQLCTGLEHLHRAGTVHQDVSPRNIMIDDSNNLTLIDFGLATSMKPSTEGGSLQAQGTPGFTDAAIHITAYQGLSDKSYWAVLDVYSLGAVLYYLLNVEMFKNRHIGNVGDDIRMHIYQADKYMSGPELPRTCTEADLIEVLQLRMLYSLVKDATSFVQKYPADKPYREFFLRPKTVTAFKERLGLACPVDACVKSPKPVDKVVTADGGYVAAPTAGEIVCICNSSADMSWFTVDHGGVQVHPYDGEAGRSAQFAVVDGSKVTARFRVVQEAPQAPQVYINPDSFDPVWFDACSSKHVLSFATNGYWSVNIKADKPGWLTADCIAGGLGDDNTLILQADNNFNCSDRSAVVTITSVLGSSKVQAECVVRQDGHGILPLDFSCVELPVGSGSEEIEFSAARGVDVRVEPRSAGWLRAEVKFGSGHRAADEINYILNLEAVPNPAFDDRDAEVILTCQMADDIVERRIRCIQQGRYISPSDLPRLDMKPTGGEVKIVFTSRYPWSLSLGEDKMVVDWLKPDRLSGAPGKDITVTFKADCYEGLTPRKVPYSLTCEGPAGRVSKAQGDVWQEGCGIEVKDGSRLFSAAGGALELWYRTGTGSTDCRVADGVDWLALGGMRIEGGWCVRQIVARKNTGAERRGSVLVTCYDNVVSVDYVQAGVRLDYITIRSVEPEVFQGRGGVGTVTFESSGPWQAAVEGVDGRWLGVDRSDGPAGIHTLQLRAAANDSYEQRQARLVLRLVGTRLMDDARISQQGHIPPPPPPKRWWWVLLILLLAGAGSGAWWYLSRPSAELLSSPQVDLQTVGRQAVAEFRTSGEWTADLRQGSWLLLQNKSGGAGTHTLMADVYENRDFLVHKGCIDIVCGDTVLTVSLTQGYNRADSLTREFDIFRATQSGINQILKRFRHETDPFNQVFRYEDGSPVGPNGAVLRGQVENCVLGETHRVKSFKEKDGYITEIVVTQIKD